MAAGPYLWTTFHRLAIYDFICESLFLACNFYLANLVLRALTSADSLGLCLEQVAGLSRVDMNTSAVLYGCIGELDEEPPEV